MSTARQLYQLQEIDLQLEATEQALRQLTSQLGESQEIAKIQSELSSKHQHLEELIRQQRSAEWEIDDLNEKITTVQKKLYGGTIKNPKELSNFQSEFNVLKRQHEQLEDKALQIMEAVEQAEGRTNSLNTRLDKLKAEWQRQQQHLSEEIAQLKTTSSNLGQEREQLIARIDPQAVDTYQRLRKRKGQAVARVEQGTCTGCRISLSVAELQRARTDRLVQCSSCGRILFLA